VCYRFTLTTPAKEIASLFDVELPFELSPRNNIALTTPIATVRLNTAGKREFTLMRFGLIPRWSKEAKPAGFGNARAETITEKPTFRDAFKKRRCLVPADGFYEWEHVGKEKLPWQFRMKDGKPFAFAGVWESWKNPTGDLIDSVAILTTLPNRICQPIHDRMPVMLARDAHQRWLSEMDAAGLTDLFTPFDAELMVSERVEDDRFRRGQSN
jgi:putative SOS response-associated peptidase YedK